MSGEETGAPGAHPTPDDLYEYALGQIATAERRAEIEAHLGICPRCAEMVGRLKLAYSEVDEWTPQKHGRVYWHARLREVLHEVAKTGTSAAKPVGQLLEHSGRIVAHIAVGLAKAAALMPQPALSPAHALLFSSAHLGPDTPETAAMAQAEGPQGSTVSVVADAKGRRLVVRLDHTRGAEPALMALLVPHSSPDKFLVPQTVRRIHESSQIIEFADLPSGNYSLFLIQPASS